MATTLLCLAIVNMPVNDDYSVSSYDMIKYTHNNKFLTCLK